MIDKELQTVDEWEETAEETKDMTNVKTPFFDDLHYVLLWIVLMGIEMYLALWNKHNSESNYISH